MDKSTFHNKVFLVTGGSGFIGGHTCKKLLDLGAQVHSVSRKKINTYNQIEWWQGDLTNIKFVRTIFESVKPDYVIHLASEVTGKQEIEYVLPTLNGNLLSSVNLLICATEFKSKRIILAGSLEEPDESNATPTPSSPYAAAKWASSSYARMFHVLYNTPVVIARLFMVYGPNQKDLTKFIPYISLCLAKNEVPQLTDGSRAVDWIYVDDVVNGLLAMSTQPNIESKTIDLGTGTLTTKGEIANKLCSLSKENIHPNFGSIPERKMEQVKKANVSNSFALLNWQARTTLDTGLHKTFLWYKENFEAGNFSNTI